jgi:hypothetical protein
MTAEELAAVVEAIGILGAALEQLEHVDSDAAEEGKAHLRGLTRRLDRLTAQGLRPSPHAPADVIDLADRRRRRGGAR